MLTYWLLCGAGFALLYYGAEWLVRGASGLAQGFGVTPLVIGLTVVAFGTSAPELVVSLVASAKAKSMIAVGNVVGSNICNMALVLGVSALSRPILADRSVVRRDIPIMLGVSLALVLFSLDSRLGRFEGAVLFAGIIAYTLFNYCLARRAAVRGTLAEAAVGRAAGACLAGAPADGGLASRPRLVLAVLAGMAGVVVGAQLVVDSAEVIMRGLGVSEKFIGLTVVAFGTSLPELATSVVAAVRGEPDISLGNLVGSNVFNILSVLGAAALVRPLVIPDGGLWVSGLWIDYLVMIGVGVLAWVMMRRTLTVSRRDGAILLACYACYLAWLVIGG